MGTVHGVASTSYRGTFSRNHTRTECQQMSEDTETPKAPSETQTNEAARKARERVFSKYALPSDRTDFGIHFEIVRRFVTLGRNGEGIEASKVESDPVPVQGAQMNVRWLRSIGLLTVTERGKYVPTPEAVKFVNARSVSDEAAAPILAELLRKTWVGEVTQATLAARPGMSSDQFLGELALAAETDKTKRTNSLQAVLEYILYARLVTRDANGALFLADASAASGGMVAGFDPAIVAAAGMGPKATTPSGTPASRPTTAGSGWHSVSTEDFALKLRMDLDVIEDLKAYLDLLKVRVERAAKTTPAPSTPPATAP